MLHAAIERQVDDNGEFVFSVLPVGRFVDESLFSVHANFAYLNVNYRVITASFYRRGSESGPEAEGIFDRYYGFCTARSRANAWGRPSVLLDSVLGTVFQFVTSFAPLSVQSHSRLALR